MNKRECIFIFLRCFHITFAKEIMACTALVLLFLLMLLFLTNLGKCAWTVTHLPGYNGALPFHLETGYINVDAENGVELFYYFIRSERNPEKDPLLIWFTGGPGCSSFNGLALEIGPIRFVVAEYNGSIPTLKYHPHAWTKVANVIFLDTPVGTGFSISKNPNGYEVGDTVSSQLIYKFIQKWLLKKPQFLSNPLYIVGDSFSGKVAPIVTHVIAEGIKATHYPLLNLKGYIIGNPVTGELVDENSRVEYAHGQGIISDELYQAIQVNCEGEDYMKPSPLKPLCTTAIDKFKDLCSEIKLQYILDPLCQSGSESKVQKRSARFLRNKYLEFKQEPIFPDIKCRDYNKLLAYHWINHNETREALHVKKGYVSEWVRCSLGVRKRYVHDIQSSLVYQASLNKKGYRALVYSGDKDMFISFVGTKKWIKSLNFSVVDEWRSWHVNGQVAGYTTLYSNNFTFATVKDAGHTAPEYKPENCFKMFNRWISDKPL